MENRAIVWYRNDLRVKDHEGLSIAAKGTVLPVYVLDRALISANQFGIPRYSYWKIHFLLESLRDLRKQLQALGSDLVFRLGNPVEEIVKLQEQAKANKVYTSQEVGTEEESLFDQAESALAAKGCLLESYWHSTLYHIEDIPWSMARLPQVFTQFRKAVEKECEIRAVFERPKQVFHIPGIQSGEIPTAEDLGFSKPESETAPYNDFFPGESGAWKRVEEYFWQKNLLHTYKETRNELLGKNFSSKFSPWLALGCISARSIFYEVKKYEQSIRSNESTYWLIFELIWRDYFKYIARQHGNKLFLKGGIRGEAPKMDGVSWLFDRWKDGQTGIPFIDANMRELSATGFMSNRGRQNVAGFLVKDLHIDWRWGAAWFESQLIDYDVASNWGNWNYVAGVGNDPREDRYFNIYSQATRYDSQTAYIKYWLPELKQASPEDLFLPKKNVLSKFGYPAPTIQPEKWVNNRKKLKNH